MNWLDKESTETQLSRRGGHQLFYSRVGKWYSALRSDLRLGMQTEYSIQNELPYFYLISVPCPCISKDGHGKVKVGRSNSESNTQRLQTHARYYNDFKVHIVRVFRSQQLCIKFESKIKDLLKNFEENAPVAFEYKAPGNNEFFMLRDLISIMETIETLDADPHWSSGYFAVYSRNPSRAKSKIKAIEKRMETANEKDRVKYLQEISRIMQAPVPKRDDIEIIKRAIQEYKTQESKPFTADKIAEKQQLRAHRIRLEEQLEKALEEPEIFEAKDIPTHNRQMARLKKMLG